MIKVLDYNSNLSPKTVCTLFADTKEEVTGTLTIVGLPDYMTPDAGSILITAKGDVALLDSEDTWNFIGEEEPAADASAAVLSDTREFKKFEELEDIEKEPIDIEEVEEPIKEVGVKEDDNE